MTANFLPVGGGRRAGIKTNFVSADVAVPANAASIQAGVAVGAIPDAPVSWYVRGLTPPVAGMAHSYVRVTDQDAIEYSYANVSLAPVNVGINPEQIQQIRGSVRTGRWLGEAGALWLLGRQPALPSPGLVPAGGVLEFDAGINIGDSNIDPRISAEAFGVCFRTPLPHPGLGFSHFRTATPTGQVFMTLYNVDAAAQDPGVLNFDWVAQAPRVNTDDIFAPNRGVAYMRSFRMFTGDTNINPRSTFGVQLFHDEALTVPFTPEVGDVAIASPTSALPANFCLSDVIIVDVPPTLAAVQLTNLAAGNSAPGARSWDVLLCRNQGLGRNP